MASNNTYVLFGNDGYSKKRFLDELRQRVGPLDVLEANTTVLRGADLTIAQLQEVSGVVPFLAEHRLVIVEGLLRQFASPQGAQSRGRSSRSRVDSLERWGGIGDVLGAKPPSTILVFLEEDLRDDNPFLREIKPLVETKPLLIPTGKDLRPWILNWIQARVSELGASIVPRAANQLAELVGGNPWALSGEIEKLALYANGRPIDEQAVAELVANTRGRSVFQMLDAVLAGQSAAAVQLVNQVRRTESASRIITMLSRQLRLILLCQELVSERVPRTEIPGRLGLPAFAVPTVLGQARRYSFDQIAAMYRLILNADLSMKRGEMEEQLAVELLVTAMSHQSAVGPRQR